MRIGYFGASTGAAAALVAAAERPAVVGAIVSRGGRPDLAGPALLRVRAPTLLIVGGSDFPVLELNRQALRELRVEAELSIVPGATHLFEEPGALEEVARLSAQWFTRHLGGGSRFRRTFSRKGSTTTICAWGRERSSVRKRRCNVSPRVIPVHSFSSVASIASSERK